MKQDLNGLIIKILFTGKDINFFSLNHVIEALSEVGYSLMRKVFCILTLAGWALAAGWTGESHAGVVIKVRALNPLAAEETAKVHYPLPAEIKETDILGQKVTFSLERPEEEEPRKTQLNFSVDEKTGGLYVDDKVVLSPKEVMTLEIDVRDVWVIAPEEIDGLRQEAIVLLEEWERREEAALAEEAEEPEEKMEQSGEEAQQAQTEDEKARLSDEQAVALALKEEILNQLDEIVRRQEDCVIIKAGVERHISGYKENIAALRQVRQDIEMLANLLQLGGQEGQKDPSSEEGEGAPESSNAEEGQSAPMME